MISIFAHRGLSSVAPENTLPALQMAFRSGADGVEFDLQLTKDGEVVLVHDDTLVRVATNTFHLPPGEFKRVITTPIEKLTLQEVRSVDVGAWKGAEFAGTRVPTLQEALKEVPKGKTAMLDIKGGPPILPRIAQRVSGQVIAVSFSLEQIKAFKALMPHVPCFYTLFSGLMDEEGLDGFSVEAGPIVTKRLADELHAKGQKLCVWVDEHPAKLDTPETIHLYEALGVDYFITNKPVERYGS